MIIELEEIRNGGEKSLLMGFILTNLLQAVKQKWNDNNSFKHITLVEEAHRLLSKYGPGDSSSKKQGVEVFTDMLAEVRKYGESLMIVDQIPEKMTPEVLKNTNTKIVHKIFAQDDKEAIGNTMALTDEQKAFLSNLRPGRAVVFSQGWSKALQVQVEEKEEERKDEGDPDDTDVRNRIIEGYYSQPEIMRLGILPGIDTEKAVSADEKDRIEETKMCLKIWAECGSWLGDLTTMAKQRFINWDGTEKNTFEKIKEGIRLLGKLIGREKAKGYIKRAVPLVKGTDGDCEKEFDTVFDDIVTGNDCTKSMKYFRNYL